MYGLPGAPCPLRRVPGAFAGWRLGGRGMLMKGARVALRGAFFSLRMLGWSEKCKEEVSVMHHPTEQEVSAMNRFRGKVRRGTSGDVWHTGGNGREHGRVRDVPSEKKKASGEGRHGSATSGANACVRLEL